MANRLSILEPCSWVVSESKSLNASCGKSRSASFCISIARCARSACIRGWCIGGGVNVAMSCDLRIAASDAVFSIPAARLGLGYRYSALKNLVDLVGPGVAKDLFFTARRIGAPEAKEVGLITRVAAPEQLEALLQEYREALAANAPLTVRAGKAIIAEILKPSPEIDHDRCRQLILGCFQSEDYAEGRKAFMEKRKPVFRGK